MTPDIKEHNNIHNFFPSIYAYIQNIFTLVFQQNHHLACICIRINMHALMQKLYVWLWFVFFFVFFWRYQPRKCCKRRATTYEIWTEKLTTSVSVCLSFSNLSMKIALKPPLLEAYSCNLFFVLFLTSLRSCDIQWSRYNNNNIIYYIFIT